MARANSFARVAKRVSSSADKLCLSVPPEPNKAGLVRSGGAAADRRWGDLFPFDLPPTDPFTWSLPADLALLKIEFVQVL